MAKKWVFDEIGPGGNADVRHELTPKPYWKQLADSLTEPALTQLLDDLRGWDEATWEHRQHPPKPRHPSEGHSENGA